MATSDPCHSEGPAGVLWFMTTLSERRRVVVLGGGYAGLMAALRLAPDHAVTLVDPKAMFVERIRLHELAAGSRFRVGRPYASLLSGTGVDHVRAAAITLDVTARRVRLSDGRTLSYDGLVYALGSRTDRPEDPRVHTMEDAAQLAATLRAPGGCAVVIGGGLTGIEAAMEIAETHPDWTVRLVTDGEVAADLSPSGRHHILATLRQRGVEIEEGRRIDSPADIDADALVWTAAMVPATELAVSAGMGVDAARRIPVEETLQVVGLPEIVVAGDAAGGLRMACATALPTGSHAADTLRRVLRGPTAADPPRPLRFRYYLKCISLGRHDGLVQFLHADDSPRRSIVTGRPAAMVKERIVRSTTWVLSVAARRPSLVPHLPTLA